MYNRNIKARPKKKTVKESPYEKHEKRILIALSLIKANGTVSEFTIRQTLKLSHTQQYQVVSDLQHNYQDDVSWNKKTRMFKRIEVKQEVKN